MTFFFSASVVALAFVPGCDGDSEDSAESDEAQDDDSGDSGEDGTDPSDSGTDSGEDGGGSETGDDTESGDDGEAAGVVSGTIEYSGAESGNLIVGLFTSNPPAGPPAVFPPFSDPAPAFPVQYDMSNVPPGEYYVIALLDLPVEGSDAGNNMPDEGEPYAASETAIEVEAGESYVVDLTLTIE